MNLYLLALFLHVSGALGIGISLGIWLFGLWIPIFGIGVQ